MRPILIVTAVLAVAGLAACANTAPSTAPQPRYVVDDRHNPKGAERDDLLICTYEEQTGTKMKRRYCATAEARQRQQEANRAAADELLGSGRTKSTHTPTADVNLGR